MESVQAYIGMGSNLGDGKAILMEAWESLGNMEGISLAGISNPFKTAPVDMKSQHWFTNAVGRLEVELAPLQLLESLLAVESMFGRARNSRSFGHEDRSLDLDLLYFGDVVMDSPDLILPHPRINGRLFVLEPLSELAPDFRSAQSRKTVLELTEDLKEKMRIKECKNQEIIRDQWDGGVPTTTVPHDETNMEEERL